MTKLLICLVIVCFFAFIYACNNARPGNAVDTTIVNANSNLRPNPESTVAATDELAKGRELYNKNCSNCHREDGTGGPTVVDGRKMKPDNLTDARRQKLPDDKYVDTMVKGIEDEGMPSYKDKLSEAEMREIVKYIRDGLQKQEQPAPANAK
jgi:mono/diheme cytochrome c family protein